MSSRAAAMLAFLVACRLFAPAAGIAEDTNANGNTTPRERLSAAIDAYARAQDQTDRDGRLEGFRRAQLLFEKAASEGADSAALQTNAGNAALQADRLGQAIAAYRRALLLQPDHPRARANLVYARSLLPAWVPAPSQGGVLDTFFFWHRTLSSDSRSSLAASCVW